MTKIYPGYAPSFKHVQKLGGYDRQCLVIELLSLKALDKVQLAKVRERLEATLSKLANELGIEVSQVVLDKQFDKALRDGLRLP